MNTTCIIIGASHAGIQMAVAVRQEGWSGRIVLIGDEPSLPYHRPPLSKAYLKGEATLAIIHPQASLDKHAIEFIASTRVLKIDRPSRLVHLDNGQAMPYDKLALCTGARLRRLDVSGATRMGVHYLRDLADADRLRAQLPNARRAVIIGAGYIGLETAASLRQLGLEVTVLEAGGRILERSVDSAVSEYFTLLHARHDVTIHTGQQVSAILGSERVEAVQCSDGSCYPADLVVIGIGVQPNVELAQEAGLDVDNGIVVDAQGCTTDPAIFAAGDCTAFPSLHLQRRARLECLAHASDQARTAAANLCGKHQAYQALPWFWSDQYTTRLQMTGMAEKYDRVVQRGQTSADSFSRFYLAAGVLVSTLCVNRPKDFIASKRLIGEMAQLDLEKLADEGAELSTCVLGLPA